MLMALISATPALAGKVVDSPFIGDSNTTSIDIDRVELNDTATILTMHGYYRPHYWIRFVPQTTLQSEGKSYKLIGSEGMTPGKELWMPESGDSVFTMIFEPLPATAESFDFNEGEGDGNFRLWDVDLTGKANSFSEYPEGLPDAMRRKSADGPLPELVYEVGRTTVNVHYLPVRSERALNDHAMFVNMFSEYEEVAGKADNATGTVTYSFNQYGPGTFMTPTMMGLNVAPGETLDVYVDARTMARYIMNRRDGEGGYLERIYSTGRYGDLDMAMSRYDGDIIPPDSQTHIWDYRMSGDEYVDALANSYCESMDKIDRLDVPDMLKEYIRNEIKNSVLFCGNSKSILSRVYSIRHDYTGDIPQDSIKGDLSPANLAKIASLFDLCDKNLVFAPNINDLIDGWRIDWTQYGAKCNPVKDILTAMPYWSKAKNASLTPDDVEALSGLSNPFLLKAIQMKQDETKALFDSFKGKTNVVPTPEVPLDQLFDAIIAPYKGKVVVVDFWDTWCGPCRNALRHHEPQKDTVFKGKDVEWVYIADESSPMAQYMQMIQGIKGRHYYLNEEQIKYLSNQLKIDGIPFYVLVNKDGTYRSRTDFRDPERYKSVVLDALK